MTKKPTATPQMRAQVLIRDRMSWSQDERMDSPLTAEEAEVLAIGAAEACWRHYGFQQLMSISLRRNDKNLWIRVAELLKGLSPEQRAPGVLRFLADHSPILQDARWAHKAYLNRMQELQPLAA